MSKFKISLLVYIFTLAGVSILLNFDTLADLLFFYIFISIFYTLALVGISMMIRMNFYLKAVNQNSNAKIVLSFDDGPHPSETLKVLDILDAFNTKAVFFMIGKNVAKYPKIAKEVVKRGHQVGIHSQNHRWYFGFLTGKTLRKEISDCQDEIEKATGVKPAFFRPPFGVTNPSISSAIRRLDLQTIGWSLRTFDTVAKTSNRIVNNVLNKLRPNNIILLHDCVSLTTEALPQILERVQQKGFTFGLLAKEPENDN